LTRKPPPSASDAPEPDQPILGQALLETPSRRCGDRRRHGGNHRFGRRLRYRLGRRFRRRDGFEDGWSSARWRSGFRAECVKPLVEAEDAMVEHRHLVGQRRDLRLQPPVGDPRTDAHHKRGDKQQEGPEQRVIPIHVRVPSRPRCGRTPLASPHRRSYNE
jgi:hypothetical protein